MSPTLSPPAAVSPRVPSIKLLTIADVAALPTSLPSGDVRYELHDGSLIVMPPPGDLHAAVQSNIATQFKIQGEFPGHGRARSEVGIVLRIAPDRLVGADAAFIVKASLPLRKSPEGYLETIPELVVEIRSPNDTGPEIRDKIADYLTAGVHVVWDADPETESITAHRPGQPPEVFSPTDTLAVPDVIPGFNVIVSSLFRD